MPVNGVKYSALYDVCQQKINDAQFLVGACSSESCNFSIITENTSLIYTLPGLVNLPPVYS